MVKQEESGELKAFAWRVVEVRNRLHIMQKDLAEMLGLSVSFLSQVEAGKTKPGYTFFKHMLEKYNVNPIYLLTGKGEMFTVDDRSQPVPAVPVNEYGDVTPIIEDMLYYIKHSLMVKSEITECYLSYLYNNKAAVASEMKEHGIPFKKPAPKNK